MNFRVGSEIDLLKFMLERAGEPHDAELVSWEEAKLYSGRLPDALIKFWMEHGRGSYQMGKFWICDPAPFQAAIDLAFAGDPEFDSTEMLTICCTAFGELTIWHPVYKRISLNFPELTAFCVTEESWHSSETGKPFSDDYIIQGSIHMQLDFDGFLNEVGEELLPQAIDKLGSLKAGEIYGFVPALALGGEPSAANLNKVRAAEHLSFLAQLAPFNLTRLTDPEPPMHPFGRNEIIRQLGPQHPG